MATIKAKAIFRLNNLKLLQLAVHLSEHDNEDAFPPKAVAITTGAPDPGFRVSSRNHSW